MQQNNPKIHRPIVSLSHREPTEKRDDCRYPAYFLKNVKSRDIDREDEMPRVFFQ